MILTYGFHPVTKDETKEKIVKYLKAIEISSKILEEGINGSLEIELEDNIHPNSILEIGSMLGTHETVFSWEDAENEDFPFQEGDDADV
jgi:hypothetical protein